MSSYLHGKRILITREKTQADVMADKVQAAHGTPLVTPFLEISCKKDPEAAAVLAGLENYQWIFITSANGAHCFFRQLKQENQQLSSQNRIAAVGTKTAKVVEDYGHVAEFIPSVFDAETMMREFPAFYTGGENCLLIRGNKSRHVIPETFTKMSIPYKTLEVYETHFNDDVKEELLDILEKDELDFITFTSPSTVEAFHAFTSEIPPVPVVCIGTTTEEAAKAYGFKKILCAEEFTVDGMIEIMVKYIKGKGANENESV